MELVYLWVEDYKNIQKQGFNFSPRFRCEYDEEKNELEIIDKEETGKLYPKNFFGDNINITAIVGENGSGKTSILKILTYLYNIGYISKRKDKTFFVFLENDNLNIQCENYKILGDDGNSFNKFIRLINKTSFKSPTEFCARTEMPLIYFSNILDFTNNEKLKHIKSYSNFYNGLEYFSGYMDGQNSNRDVDTFIGKFANIRFQDNLFFDFIDDSFIPKIYQLSLHIYEIGAWITMSMYTDEEGNRKNYFEEFFLLEDNNVIFPNISLETSNSYFYKFFALYIIYYSINKKKYKDFKEEIINKLDIERIKEEEFSFLDLSKVIEVCIDKLDKNNKLKKEDFSEKNINELLALFNYYNTFDINKNVNNTWTSASYENDENIKKVLSNNLLSKLLEDNILRIDFFYDENTPKTFNSLSTGEQEYIKLLTNYSYTLLNQDKLENNEYILLFDEVDITLHPTWQKRLFNDLQTIYNKVSKILRKNIKIHILLTSHSPFLLSDLPKENVIFLEKGKQVYPFEDGKQTFGANIHTLLSHGFFMKDGLMGEFAKDKIQSIIKYHEEILKLELTKKENETQRNTEKEKYEKEHKTMFWQIQSIIGDDYLKQVIKNHLIEIEKIVIGNDEAKKEEVKRLKAQIELLEK